MRPVLLWTDGLIYLLLSLLILLLVWVVRDRQLAQTWGRVFKRRLGFSMFLILLFYVSIGVLDSIHFYRVQEGQVATQDTGKIASVLDVLIAPVGERSEKTYSSPLARHLYNKTTQIDSNGVMQRTYPKLQLNQSIPEYNTYGDVLRHCLWVGLGKSLLICLLLCGILFLLRRCYKVIDNYPWRTAMLVVTTLITVVIVSMQFAPVAYLFGTDKVGHDVLYLALKSIRTGLIIGTLTTLIMLPFALFLGVLAGYFGGVMDDIIQYIYITLSSIPGVLLIAATILSLQVVMDNHPQIFASSMQRADMRLLLLCAVLGIASWTGLCRLLRAETLKLITMDYIKAARALGASHLQIITRHLLPNMTHIILITVTLDFSGLVLAEAVLSYVGVGVDPLTYSWGNMINASRLEMARDPVVWWPLCAAFIFMFFLVLSANLFADVVRDAFNPRTKRG